MPAFYKNIIKPLLFKQDPEKSHELVIFALKSLSKVPFLCKTLESFNLDTSNPIELFGLQFPNRVGIAAGFDKNAECFKFAPALGFGHIEVGTVTAQRQPGNPKPRLHRLPQHLALINRMGFNSEGAPAVAKELSKALLRYHRPCPIGINIGRSRAVANEDAIADYLQSFNTLADYADYFTINVSSPNTSGLRNLQSKDALSELLSEIQSANKARAKRMGANEIPVLVKIAPDLTTPQVDDVLQIIEDQKLSGIIATNTTLARPGNLAQSDLEGGLSGAPLTPISQQIIRYISLATNGKLPIIASGGIMGPSEAGKALDLGASLVQVYTGMVYEGPFIGKKIAQALAWQDRDWV